MYRLLRTATVAFLATVAVLMVPAAASAQPTTETNHAKNVTFTFVDVAPTCEGGPLYEITITYNGVEHVTEFEDGRVHVTFTQTGTFVARALEAGEPDASGRFTVWGGFNQNNQTVNGTFTFSARGAFETGEKINTHITNHFNTTPTGAEFFFSKCHD